MVGLGALKGITEESVKKAQQQAAFSALSAADQKELNAFLYASGAAPKPAPVPAATPAIQAATQE